MTAKKRTRVNKPAEGHEVAWHERMFCSKCPREFYGVCAFDAHRPCTPENWEEVKDQLEDVDDLWVLVDDLPKFHEMQEKVAKARAGRANK
jgi:hypothetical protein